MGQRGSKHTLRNNHNTTLRPRKYDAREKQGDKCIQVNIYYRLLPGSRTWARTNSGPSAALYIGHWRHHGQLMDIIGSCL